MRSLFAIILFTAACDSQTKTEEFCNRADSCNILRGSVEECVEDLDAALGRLSPSDRDEVLYEVQQCLDRPSCSGFATCTDNLDRVDQAKDQFVDPLETVE